MATQTVYRQLSTNVDNDLQPVSWRSARWLLEGTVGGQPSGGHCEEGERVRAFGSDDQTKAKRSRAWIYYGIIALLGLLLAPSTHWQTLWATVGCGAYAVYIFRGGKYVYWVW
jgi:hypothetical protein